MSVYSQVPKTDSLLLNDKKWNELKKDVDYTETYKDDKPIEHSNFSFSGNFLNTTWFQIVTAFIILIILGILILKLIKGNVFRFNQKIERNINYQLLDENLAIDEMDLDKILVTVLEKQDYKLAIRIHFLIIIKQLDKSEYIKWEKDKTNGNYISEMSEQTELPDFMYLVLIFEKVWYGDMQLNINDYFILSKYFEKFLLKISRI